jgi:hypothetical protein
MNLQEYNRAIKVLEQIIMDKVTQIPFKVMDNTPDTFEGMIDYKNKHGHLAIYSGGSDKTIFSSKYVNYAFRAIHDSRHILTGLRFTLQDEEGLAYYQGQEFYEWTLQKSYKIKLAQHIFQIIYIEIYEQRLYVEQTGKFVEDQKAFMLSKLGLDK